MSALMNVSSQHQMLGTDRRIVRDGIAFSVLVDTSQIMQIMTFNQIATGMSRYRIVFL